MSRKGSGTYTVPNTFVPSTRIASAEVNANFTDIATALTGSLATDGQSAMTGQIKSASGSISAPGISFASELGSGWYRAGSNDFRFSVAGADVLKATAAGLTVYGALTATVTISDASITNVKLANMAASTIKANVTGGAAVPTDKTLTEVLDALAGSSQGSIMYRGASAWTVLTPGTSGHYLKTQGAAANPTWDAVPSVSFADAALTGTPTAPTASAGTNTTQIATTAFVTTAFSGATTTGAVNTYAFLVASTVAAATAGTTYAGSGLRYSATDNVAGATPSGTWRAMGTTTNNNSYATLFVRTV